MGRRLVAAAVCVAVTSMAAASGGPASAAPTLTVPVTSVAVGQALAFDASGCPPSSVPGVDQGIEGGLVSGTGAAARRAGIVDTSSDQPGSYQVIPQGWVDPDEPAVLVARCVSDAGGGDVVVLHTYPEIAIDVTPSASFVPTLDVTYERTAAAGGQVVTVTGTGCAPDSGVLVHRYVGSDLSFRTISARTPAAIDVVPADGMGNFSGEVELNDERINGPVAEGDYVLSALCDLSPEGSDLAPPVMLNVEGTNPSDSLVVALDTAGMAGISGKGCTGDRTVQLTYYGFGARPGSGEIEATVDVVPDGDGSWSYAVADVAFVDMTVAAYCGVPTGDGFRYIDAAVLDQLPRDPHDPVVPNSPTAPAANGLAAPAAVPIPGRASYTG